MAEGLGLGRVVLHEPRIIVTNLIAEDALAEEKTARICNRAFAPFR